MGHRPPCQFPWGPADQACRCVCIVQPEQWPSTPALSLFPLGPLQSTFPRGIGVRVCSAGCFLRGANCSNQRLAKD